MNLKQGRGTTAREANLHVLGGSGQIFVRPRILRDAQLYHCLPKYDCTHKTRSVTITFFAPALNPDHATQRIQATHS
jgi:hypothetical protein